MTGVSARRDGSGQPARLNASARRSGFSYEPSRLDSGTMDEWMRNVR
jgi:hypothetical protein